MWFIKIINILCLINVIILSMITESIAQTGFSPPLSYYQNMESLNERIIMDRLNHQFVSYFIDDSFNRMGFMESWIQGTISTFGKTNNGFYCDIVSGIAYISQRRSNFGLFLGGSMMFSGYSYSVTNNIGNEIDYSFTQVHLNNIFGFTIVLPKFKTFIAAGFYISGVNMPPLNDEEKKEICIGNKKTDDYIKWYHYYKPFYQIINPWFKYFSTKVGVATNAGNDLNLLLISGILTHLDFEVETTVNKRLIFSIDRRSALEYMETTPTTPIEVDYNQIEEGSEYDVYISGKYFYHEMRENEINKNFASLRPHFKIDIGKNFIVLNERQYLNEYNESTYYAIIEGTVNSENFDRNINELLKYFFLGLCLSDWGGLGYKFGAHMYINNHSESVYGMISLQKDFIMRSSLGTTKDLWSIQIKASGFWR